MWFLSRSKVRRQLPPNRRRERFCPRLETLEERCLMSAGMSAGNLDTTFGSGGVVTSALVGDNSYDPLPVVVYPNTGGLHPDTDGKIVAASWAPAANGELNFALVRYTAAGLLDSSANDPLNAFGTNGSGMVTTVVGVKPPNGNTYQSEINALAIDAEGKIVAAGWASSSSKGDMAFALARYTASGSLDTSFNKTGIALTNVNPMSSGKSGSDGVERTFAVAIDASGNIDVGGGIQKGTSDQTADQFALLRYHGNGTLDSSFGPNRNGIVVTPQFVTNQGDQARSMAIQPDGNIVLAGFAYNGASGSINTMAAARYLGAATTPGTVAGQLDPSFGTGGFVLGLTPSGSTSTAAGSVLVQSSGAIVLAGYSNPTGTNVQTLARLTSAGQLDHTFGTLDPTFGHTGFAFNPNIGIPTTATAIAQAPNGDLLVSGTAGDPNNSATWNAAVAAFLPSDGSLDTTFGTTNPANGTATADFGGVDRGRGIAIQSDGKVVVAGFTASTGNGNLCLARFLPPTNTFTASPTTVTAGSSVTLYASSIADPNLTGPVTQVAFYVDANGDGFLDGGDTLLGTATQNNNGTWSITFSTTGWTTGTYTLFAQATDGVNLSVPLVVSVRVQ